MFRLKGCICFGSKVLNVLFLVILVMAVLSPHAEALSYPTKPIKLIVSYSPGGTSDTAARALSQWIADKKKLSQPILVVNRPGGAGSLGQAEVMSSEPDGYTLLLEAQMAAAMPIILPNCPFELEKRTWIASFYLDPYFFFVRADSEFKTLQDVVNRAKADPATFSWACTGPTSAAAFTIGLLLHKNGVSPLSTRMVAFRGGSEEVNAVAGGHVMFGCQAGLKGLIDGGKLRALSAVSPQRHPMYSDVPTVSEAGFADFPAELVPYNGISGPKGISTEIVDLWAKMIQEATEDLDFRAKSKALNKIVVFWGPEESKRVMLRNHEVFKEMAPILGLEKK